MAELFEDQLRVKVVVGLDVDERDYSEVFEAAKLVGVDGSEVLKKLICCQSCRVQEILELGYEKDGRRC